MQTYIDNTCNFFIYFFFLLLKLEIKSFFFVNVRKVEPIVLDDSEDDIFKSGKNLFSFIYFVHVPGILSFNES